jgi:ribosomal protein S19E (S16A)
MTEQELDTLEQIWEGKTNWGAESEQVLDNLAAGGYIEIAEKRRAAREGQAAVDEILVRITDEGVGHLSGSAY